MVVLTVTSPRASIHVALPVSKPIDSVSGFVESGGCVAIEAPHFSRAVNSRGIEWSVIDGFGRTLGAVTPFPATAECQEPGGDCPRLEYDIYLFQPGKASVEAVVAPTLNFVPGHGLRFAVSMDDEVPLVEEYVARPGDNNRQWAESVMDGVRKVVSVHPVAAPGRHVLKFWMIDPGIVLERVVVDMGGERPSYLGPPESLHIPAR